MLWTTAELLRVVSALAHPVLPQSTAKVWTLLGSKPPWLDSPIGWIALGTIGARHRVGQVADAFSASG